MTLSQDLARALFHRENNVIPVTSQEREILIDVAPLRGASDAFTALRFHSSRVSLSFSLFLSHPRRRRRRRPEACPRDRRSFHVERDLR